MDINALLANAPTYDSKHTFWDAMASHAPTGLVLEFGVSTCTSLKHFAKCFQERTVWGFDWFRGLPERWDRDNPEGAFDLGGALPVGLPENARIVPGLFKDSLPSFLSENEGEIALAHIDCDLYSSTDCVLRLLEPRMKEGTVLVFDEFWHYPTAHEHEARAFSEFIERTGWGFEVLGQVPSTYSPVGFRLVR